MIKKHEKQDIIKWIIPLLLLCISVLFVLLFSFTTSPLYNGYGTDSEIFRMMGHLAYRGYIPYTEFWDHKGPFIVTIEWLGCVINEERIGIFIVQILFLFCSIVIIYITLKQKHSRKKTFLLIVFILIILRSFYDGGNLTEEYCLPFLLGSVYLFYGYYKKKHKTIIKSFGFYGIALSICLFSRATNAFPLVVIIGMSFLTLLINKEWKNIIVSFVFLLFGILIIMIPYVVYFYYNNALYEMIYATFIYNIKYGNKYIEIDSQLDVLKKICYALMLFWTMIIGSLKIKSNKKDMLGWCVTITSIIGLIFHFKMRFYLHYYMIYIPIIVLAFLCLPDIKLKQKGLLNRIIIVSNMFIICFGGVKSVTGIVDIRNIYKSYDVIEYKEKIAKNIISVIPNKQNTHIIAYNLPANFYLMTDIYPCYRNFILQDLHTDDVEIRKGFIKDLKSLKAHYIVTKRNNKGKYIKFINDNYHIIKENDIYLLYEKNNVLNVEG